MKTLSYLFAGSLIACTTVYSPLTMAEEEQHICATVEEFLEPSDDCAYFRVSGDFMLEDNPDKTLGYYMYNADEEKTMRDIKLLESSLENKREVYIQLSEDDGYVENVEVKCP